jgi:outer membrane protein assembly factor BamB
VVACDRSSGEVVWQAALGKRQADDRAALPPDPVEIFPGAWGGVLTPIASDGNRVFVPVVNQRTVYSASEYDKVSMFDFSDATGLLVALDAATGLVLWQSALASPAVGGATIANDVVMIAGLDGVIRLYAAEDGADVGRFSAGTGINATPAVAGDLVIVPAAGGFVPSRESGSGGAEPRVIALTIPAGDGQSSL